MQFQADMLDVPVERPQVIETTALGAAPAWRRVFGTGLGAVARTWKGTDTFRPQMASDKRARLIEGWRQAVAKTLTA